MRPYIDDRFNCVDCGCDTCVPPKEYYAVHNALWSEACAVEPVLPDESGMLCIGCLERVSAASSPPSISKHAT